MPTFPAGARPFRATPSPSVGSSRARLPSSAACATSATCGSSRTRSSRQRFRSQRRRRALRAVSEPFVTDRAVEAVAPGSEYPYANTPVGTAAHRGDRQKWGQKVLLTDEEIARNAYAGAAVDRELRKVINSIISQVDAITMSAIAFGRHPDVRRHGRRRRGVVRCDRQRSCATSCGPRRHREAEPRATCPTRWSLNDTQYAYLMTDDEVHQRAQAGGLPRTRSTPVKWSASPG